MFTSMNPITDFEEYCRMFNVKLNESREGNNEVVLEKIDVEDIKKKGEEILRVFQEKGGEKNNGII